MKNWAPVLPRGSCWCQSARIRLPFCWVVGQTPEGLFLKPEGYLAKLCPKILIYKG